jgi:DNA polymerase III subunit gamma/tau
MAKRKPAAESPPTPTATPEPESPSPPTAPASSPSTSYTVLARRYRPQQFSDIVGQEPVAQALTNAIESNRVAHAYLFTGARGVGKTSTARILAKALNCVHGPSATPCDKCDICEGITAGDDVDVIEIDAASNTGVDNIRDLRQNVQYKPNRARFKIYIIDEVHMLSNAAFNALLKTLEEPPPHIKFIFATTELNKVPITVRSRCQRFDFINIGQERIIGRLKEVVAAEHAQADDEALELVARRAGGSMRDAQSLLDQLLAFGGDRLTAAQVHALLGTTPVDRVVELAGAVLEHDAAKALQLLDRAATEGLQLSELLDQLIDYWRDLMVVSCAGAEARDLSVPTRQRDVLLNHAKSQRLDTILAGLDILANAKNRLHPRSHMISHSRIWMEMTLLRLARLEDLVPISQLAQWVAGGAAPAAAMASPKQTTSNVVSGVTTSRTSAARPTMAMAPAKPAPASPANAQVASQASPPSAIVLTAESIAENWPKVLEAIGLSLSTSLKMAGIPAISGPNSLAIRFPADYNAFYKRFQDAEGSDRLAAVLGKLTGKPWQVRVESLGSPPAAQTGAVDPSRARQQREEQALRHPFVAKVKDSLKASFLQPHDEGFNAGASAGAEDRPTQDRPADEAPEEG